MNDLRADPRSPPAPLQAWVRLLLLAAGIVVAVAIFLGYGQPELLLEAVNLRYCG